jgi:hypothetical protein
VGAAGEVALTQTRRKRPVESGQDRVVIGQDCTFVGGIGVEEVLAIVGESGSLEVEDLRAAVEALVDDFAGVVLGWVVAEECICAGCWVDTTALQLNPGIRKTALGAKCSAESCVGCAGISGVGVSHDNDGVAGRPGTDVVCNLLQVGVASYVVLIFVARLLSVEIFSGISLDSPSISVQVVHINVSTLRHGPSHKSKALRSQAVRTRSIGASVPLDTLVVDPVVVGDCVEAAANGYATRSSSPLRVVVGRVDGCMVIEVFLHMDEIVVVLGKVGANLL